MNCRIVALSHCRIVAILCLFHKISYRKLLIISISDCNKNKRCLSADKQRLLKNKILLIF